MILVNSTKYCCKSLSIKQGAKGSYHFHKVKEETFQVLEGIVHLVVEDKVYNFTSEHVPVTIESGEKHSIEGVTDAIILEVSTPHDDEDVFRLRESIGGE